MAKKFTLLLILCLTGIANTWAKSYWTSFEKDCLEYTIFHENDTTVQLDGYTGYIKHYWDTLNIPDYAYCSSFDKAYRVINVRPRAFMCENYLETVYISNTVENIGEEAFLACKALKNVTIGKCVSTIELDAFTECVSLESITFLNPEPPSTGEFEDEHYFYTTLYVPEESINKYRDHPVWGEFENILPGNEINSIGSISSDKDYYEIARYNLSGMPVDKSYKGPVIIKYANGKTIKSF